MKSVKTGFTLLEMLIVVVVLAILMGIVFRLGSIGTNSSARTKTVYRMQCLENCLSGYYAAFGSYPPVQRHGSSEPYLKVNDYGIQKEQRNENIFGWTTLGSKEELESWQQVEAACRAQPVACNFPFPKGYREVIRGLSDEGKEQASNESSEIGKKLKNNETQKRKLLGGFDDGGSDSGATGRFGSNKDEVSWREIQLFRFGLMSYLLPRYLVMMCGADDFFAGGFAQWSDNNTFPCNPFTGNPFNSWQEMKDCSESNNKTELAKLANIPSQAVCARWMPNLAGICACNRDLTLFGINIKGAENDSSLRLENILNLPIYSPNGPESNSNQDQYLLDGVTVQDGWGNDFYYYSPSPHQKYTLWSAGPNGRTFPPWISRSTLGSKENECVVKWTHDDIVHMSN